MKKFAQSLVLVAAAAASFTACKKEAFPPETAPPPAAEVQATRNQFPPIMAAPKLVKKGADSLVYNADGSLQKVMVSASYYRTFSKAGNVLTVTYFSSGAFAGKIEYTLDAAGRASEAKYTGFPANGTTPSVYVYQYDASNRLIKRFNKNFPAVYSKFFWSDDGKQLNQVKWYTEDNHESSSVHFTYKPETDHLKTWSKRSGLDSYLNIFGTRPAKMVASEDLQHYDDPGMSKHEVFSYKYDADGYPVEQDVHTFGTLAYVGTLHYKYSQQ